ncbi:MAG: hypothetical protein MJH10_18935, partial [Epibacterium sp.]|nr:hypothetical protein [Epibacterium sp.]NQX75560.1 hypothetical protein [Epibacterium sp.]
MPPYQRASRLSGNLSAVNAAFDMLGRTAFASTLTGGNQASLLVDRFGGADQFNTAVGAYWQAFYSDAERLEYLMGKLRGRFKELNLEMPTSREGLRKLIEAQRDLEGAGGETWASLMKLTGAFAELIPAATDAASAVNSVARQAQLIRTLRGDVTSAMGVVRGLINADISKVRSDTATTVRDLGEDLSTARADISSARSAITDFIDQISTHSVDKFRAMRDDIRSALADRGDVSDAQRLTQYRAAQARIFDFATGAEFTQEQLATALSGVRESSASFFSSYADYAFDNARTTQALRDIEGLTQERLTDAEKQVAALRKLHGVSEEGFTSLESAVAALQNATAKEDQLTKQIAAVELASDMEIDRLEDLLTATRQTADAALGIPPALQDIASALGGLETAISSLKSVGASSSAGSGAANTNSVPRWKARELAIAAGTGDRSALYAFEQRILNAGRAGLANDWERGEFDRL